jgi:hypothetical protein
MRQPIPNGIRDKASVRFGWRRGLRERFSRLYSFFLILGALALLALPAWATISLTQSASTGASSSALSVSLASNTTAGHLLIVSVFYASGATSGVIITACDGGSCGATCATSTDSFTAVANMPLSIGNHQLYVAYAMASSALTSFTACGNQGSHSTIVAVYEYASTTGWQALPLDTSSTNTNTGTTTGNGGSITPAVSGELIFSATAWQAVVAGITVSGTGMTNQPTSSGATGTGWAHGGLGFSGDGCDNENSGNALTTCTFNWTTATDYAAAIAAFKPVAASTNKRKGQTIIVTSPPGEGQPRVGSPEATEEGRLNAEDGKWVSGTKANR